MINEYKKIIALDWGSKRIGLAVFDSEVNIVLPLDPLNSIKEIEEFVKEEEIDLIVLGEPKSLSGDLGNYEKFTAFKNNLESRISLPLKLLDERLTSKQADVILGKKEKDKRDSVSAMLILESYLEKNHEQGN
ncbi:Holliday junction resolvase RuvX [bacterium]|nr:Holliday junction resolvase RuvX [bacterium]